ncbi:hypothetical protein M426DRAFT_323857 [Hypoxylon sp. CI-4A]|nr:hypothetical protein M426DRAFT_323857 [Hypoxylon sp. CI-4A]
MTSKLVKGKATKILILNPNSSNAMTDGMKSVLDYIDLPYSTEVYTYTAPSSAPASINDGTDLEQSTKAVLQDLQNSNPDGLDYDGVVIACYSVHPLVAAMQQDPKFPRSITGIFEASVLAALSLLGPSESWGIVTTGKFWEDHLADGVDGLLGTASKESNSRFAGVESTGLNASDFHHGVDPAIVKKKLNEATKRLLVKPGVKCIVMGCAGMAGLEDIIRNAAYEEKGEQFAYSELHVMDGIKAGIMQIEQMVKYQRMLPQKL